jgi:hypothetical protein
MKFVKVSMQVASTWQSFKVGIEHSSIAEEDYTQSLITQSLIPQSTHCNHLQTQSPSVELNPSLQMQAKLPGEFRQYDVVVLHMLLPSAHSSISA